MAPSFRRCAGANRYAIGLAKELGVEPQIIGVDPTMTSPCIKVCALEDGICVGCRRSIAEIVAWGAMSDLERRAVMERIEAEAEAIRIPTRDALD